MTLEKDKLDGNICGILRRARHSSNWDFGFTENYGKADQWNSIRRDFPQTFGMKGRIPTFRCRDGPQTLHEVKTSRTCYGDHVARASYRISCLLHPHKVDNDEYLDSVIYQFNGRRNEH